MHKRGFSTEGAGKHLRRDARSSPLAKHAADGQGHDVIADGIRDGEELVIIGPVAERYEFVRAAIRRTLPPVIVEDQSLPFNQKLSHQHAELHRANISGCEEGM